MAKIPELILGYVPSGMNSALDAALLDNTSYAWGVNVALDQQLLRQRPGARVMPLAGEPSVVEALSLANIQGARVHNPAKGQGTQIFGENLARIIVAAGGRHYSLRPEKGHMIVEDISGEGTLAPDVHLAWMESAEQYLVSCDGTSLPWIWDGERGILSKGLAEDREAEGAVSQIPAGSRCPVYAHGRLWVVINEREVLAGDIIHGTNQTSPQDLLSFTETLYWAEGQFFAPPSATHDVMASSWLPVSDSSTGQGDLLFHGGDAPGIFSIDGNVFPRTKWSDTPMVKQLLFDAAATGPYALASHDGDVIMRTRQGIESLRSARSEAGSLGKPNKPISEEVSRWLKVDHAPWLRFASLNLWRGPERLLCTCSPEVNGSYRTHGGLVSANLDVMDSQQTVRAWEGLWTYPAEIRGVTQLVRGLFAGEEKLYGIHRGADGRNRFVEHSEDLEFDVMEDGRSIEIECQVATRARVEPGNHLMSRTPDRGEVYFRDVSEAVDLEVFHRRDQEHWAPWGKKQSVDVNQPYQADCPEKTCPPEDGLEALGYEMGEARFIMSGSLEKGRRHQWLLRWRGSAKLLGFQVFWQEDAAMHDGQSQTGRSKPKNRTLGTLIDDFSYARSEQ